MSTHTHTLATRAVHGGRAPSTGDPVVTPLVQSVNYVEDIGTAEGLRYPRYGNTPNAEHVQRRLASLEGTEAALVLGDGTVVIAPLYEERIFRSWVYGGLRRWMGPVGSTILSAAAFSLYHLEPVAFPVTFALGLAAGFLRERTGGLHAPIALHACYNAVQVLGVVSARGG